MTRHDRRGTTVALIVVALIVVALIGAGCSGGSAGSADTDTATATDTPRAKAATFSECMRDNGVKDFPDPDASGELTIDGVLNGSSLDSGSATWKEAMTACKDLQPSGFTGGGRRSSDHQEAALAFARCIRDNGVKDFPDPVNGEPLVNTNRIPSAATSDGMAVLNAAMRTCRDHVRDVLGDR